jgi:hypothetical protein
MILKIADRISVPGDKIGGVFQRQTYWRQFAKGRIQSLF